MRTATRKWLRFFNRRKSTDTFAAKTLSTPRTGPSPWHPANAPQPEMLTTTQEWLRFFSRLTVTLVSS